MSLFANCRSQLLFDRLGRYLKLFVSTVIPYSHEFVSQFGLAHFYRRKAPKNYRENRVVVRVFSWMSQRPVETARTWTATTAVIAATDWAKTAKTQQVKTATTRLYTFTAWNINWFRNYHVAYALVLCIGYYSVCNVFEIYNNNGLPRLIMIIINIIILYLKHIT